VREQRTAIRSQPARIFAWALVDEHGKFVNWESLLDGDEGFEIHRTRKLAKGACFAGERVVRVEIIER
jgi:hypothetical protein